MKTNIQIFEFNGSQIEFDLTGNVMVNATEMAKVFGKDTYDFLRNESTQKYIKARLSSGNSRNSEVLKEEDIYRTNHRTGTWMNRAFALKFAAWLDPTFEVWIYDTIEFLIFGNMKTDVKEKIDYEGQRNALFDKLMADNPDFATYVDLDHKVKERAGNIKKQVRSQINLFGE